MIDDEIFKVRKEYMKALNELNRLYNEKLEYQRQLLNVLKKYYNHKGSK